jgi:hypothetical protein
VFRVGLISAVSDSNPDPTTSQLIAKIGGVVRGSPKIIRGETEVLLTGLEEGYLDIVIGHFEKKSPWSARVTLGPPLKTEMQGKSELLLRPAMKNGENAWISLIEREARDLAPAE